jgi:hypothetical protein
MPLSRSRLLLQQRYALSFDGVDDNVQISPLNGVSGFPVTAALWLKMLAANPSQYQQPAGQYPNLYIENPPNTYELRATLKDTGGVWKYVIFTSDWRVDYGDNFIYIVMVFEQTKLSVYANGVYKGSVSATPGYTFQYPTEWYLGRAYYGYYANCIIGEVSIYSRALSLDEILWNYNYPGNPVRNGLVLWLPATDDAIQPPTWYDRSGFNNNGTIYGATKTQVIKAPSRLQSPARVLTAVR